MYIYINKDIIINKKNIIGIFNIENDKFEVYNKLIDEKYLTDISNGNPKTLILYEDKQNIKGIIVNISSKSIEKRNK